MKQVRKCYAWKYNYEAGCWDCTAYSMQPAEPKRKPTKRGRKSGVRKNTS